MQHSSCQIPAATVTEAPMSLRGGRLLSLVSVGLSLTCPQTSLRLCLHQHPLSCAGSYQKDRGPGSDFVTGNTKFPREGVAGRLVWGQEVGQKLLPYYENSNKVLKGLITRQSRWYLLPTVSRRKGGKSRAHSPGRDPGDGMFRSLSSGPSL